MTEGDSANPFAPELHAVELAWADRVRGNREQVDRLRELADPADFYAPVATMFRAEPARSDDAVLDRLLGLARPGERWLDIGAGAGRYALPVARHVGEVVAIDPSDAMLGQLREAMVEFDIREHRHGPRPLAARPAGDRHPARRRCRPRGARGLRHRGDRPVPRGDGGGREPALRRGDDGALAGHDRRPVLAADPRRATRPASRRCASSRAGSWLAAGCSRSHSARVPRGDSSSREEAHAFLRRQLWLEPGSDKDRRLGELVEALPAGADGSVVEATPAAVGVVSWAGGRI